MIYKPIFDGEHLIGVQTMLTNAERDDMLAKQLNSIYKVIDAKKSMKFTVYNRLFNIYLKWSRHEECKCTK